MDPPGLPSPLLKRFKKHEDFLGKQDFYILVWGSGTSSPHYAKRIAVRDHLVDQFGSEKVFMSEDVRFSSMVEQHGLATAEAIQAGSVDGIVVLDTSIGPHSELLNYRDIIAGKVIVFVANEHKEARSFAGVAYDTLKVEGYTPDEYASCETIRRKVTEFLSGLRFRKACRKPLKGVFGG